MYSFQNRKLEKALCKGNKYSAVKLSFSNYSTQIELSMRIFWRKSGILTQRNKFTLII